MSSLVSSVHVDVYGAIDSGARYDALASALALLSARAKTGKPNGPAPELDKRTDAHKQAALPF